MAFFQNIENDIETDKQEEYISYISCQIYCHEDMVNRHESKPGRQRSAHAYQPTDYLPSCGKKKPDSNGSGNGVMWLALTVSGNYITRLLRKMVDCR